MTEPDYETLALRMGDAANLLEELSPLHGYADPEFVSWSPDELRAEARAITK